jgi:hypothetical protein
MSRAGKKENAGCETMVVVTKAGEAPQAKHMPPGIEVIHRGGDTMEILFLTAGSYSDYHILGGFVGEASTLVEIKNEIRPLFKEISDLRMRCIFPERGNREQYKLQQVLQEKRDLVSYENLLKIAIKYGVRYIDQTDENTIGYDD